MAKADAPTYLLEGRYLAESLLAQGETTDVFKGKDTWLDWKALNDTLKEDSKKPEKSAEEKEAEPKMN